MPNDSSSSQQTPKITYSWGFEPLDLTETGVMPGYRFELTGNDGTRAITVTGSFAPADNVSVDDLEAAAKASLPVDEFCSFIERALKGETP